VTTPAEPAWQLSPLEKSSLLQHFVIVHRRFFRERCGSRDVQFALGVEELADDGPLIEVRRTRARFPERELPIYKASAIGLLTRRELNVGGEG
jgi:hypothetical protein